MIEVLKGNIIINSAKWVTALLFLFTSIIAAAQPANDNCANAITINIPNNGYGTGTFNSSTNDISQATLQTGETFAPAILVAGQNKKSMWYKFTIPTTRAVRVTLAQPGTAITAGNAGFAVFKINTCLPTNASISTKLTPIGTFGETYHPCVDSGQYLIQVSGNNNANGPLFVELRISDSTGALYDHPSEAYNFGVVNPHSKFVDYLISCQSIEDADERCNVLYNASQYHKSSWHTFTTPAYFDYLSVLLSNTTGGYYVNGNTFKKFGYTLYKGNAVTTALTSLVTVDGCDSLLTDGYYAAYKMYKCGDLEPNTTYTIQLFAHETFNDNIRLGLAVGGTAPTQAPQPVSTNFPATNKFGTLVTSPSAPTKTLTDFLACNSRLSSSACNPSLPAAGVVFNNKKYNLSSFFTFTLAATSSMNFVASGSSPTTCGPNLLLRVFKLDVTAACSGLDTAMLVGTFVNSADIDCLTPGTYTVQVMGTDTTLPYNSFYYSTATSNSARCLSSNLGSKIYLSLRSYSRQATNNFSLSKPGAFDTINRVGNVMAPLVSGNVYQMKTDTFACANTVLPPDTTCNPRNKKVMYRQFIVADSGVARFTSLDWYYEYKLYKGDANALATSQNAHAHPSVINGLVAQTQCLNYTYSCTYKNVCVTPGTYTFASFGYEDDIGKTDRPSVGFNIVSTKHYTPQLAQDMGSILDSVPAAGGSRKSDIDSFSCKDNAVAINGYLPCSINNIRATKAIYRQFYLKESALVSISSNGNCGFATGKRTLFSGKATDGLAGLTPVGGRWNCFTNTSYTACDLLPAGWYTVVSYGSGPTYENPMQNVNQDGIYGSYTGQKDEFTITVTVCASPKYNRPHKASVDAANQPHLIQWKNRIGSTPAYPRTDTTYSLPTEGFNCVDDVPFNLHPVIACDTTMKKVAYWVFRTTTETYVEINTSNFWGMVYALDVRKDSALLATATPIQPCVKGISKIQLCRLPAGTYTLIIFAPPTAACSSVTPKIYVDQIQESRFDHANKAYDFGIVPPDNAWHRGKVGEVNPQNPGRAASSDFFSCTAGTQPTDPTNARCVSDNIYNMYVPSKLYMYEGNVGSGPEIVRRNLWYTFVVDQPGRVYVKVENKTATKFPPYRFAVYRSDVNGGLSFVDVVNSGQVDSSMAQGLTLVGQNGWPNYCNALEDGINFYRDPCTQFAPQRYYVLVENRNPYGYYNYDVMNPNNQLEVAISIDSVNLVPTKYDHYYRTYDFGNVGAGKHTGGVDNFSCATRNSKDPINGNGNCTKTLWYKFTSTITGNVRYRIKVGNDVIKYSSSDIQLFQEEIPGDSTSGGLTYQPGTSFRATDNTLWTQHCVFPGTWYLLLPGCNQVNENVYPEIELVEQEGDFCSRPAVVTLAGAGTITKNTIINCHTIGTDYGEFNPTLTCPADAVTSKYKSSWFRLDISGNDTLDVTTYISENTNVLPANIKYRMMTGNCGAMQEQSCVQDAQTQNTYKCLTAGSYYFQVFVPITTTPTNTTQVTGDISLHLAAIPHADTCAPVNDCLANANFIPQFDCTTDTAVRFVNYSTFGSTIQYQWNFGYNGQTSTAVSPTFNYPQLATAQTYDATLKMQNTACNGRDSVTIPITIPGRPKFTLGPDTSLCKGGNITLDATSWAGSTYRWNTNATTPTINTTGTGVRLYWARVTYNGCIATDTIRVFVNTITPRNQTRILCGGQVLLSSTRNLQEEHNWSTGETTPTITADTAGVYYNAMSWNGCTIIDTFNVIETIYSFGSDTTVCLKQPYKLNALSAGATGYLWQNNSTASSINATTPGLYWVQVNYGTCSIRDSINIDAVKAIVDTANVVVCSGQSYTLPSGKVVSAAGIYNDTIRYASGCDSLITTSDITLATFVETSVNKTICSGQAYTLPWGAVVNTTGVYSDVLKGESGCDSIKNTVNLIVTEVLRTNSAAAICSGQTFRLPSGLVVGNPGVYNDTLTNAAGCDSLITSITLSVGSLTRINANAFICSGEAYTLPSGVKVNAPGLYNDTLRYAAGCDSLITSTNLTVRPITRTNSSAFICAGETFTLPSGITVNAPGDYSDTTRYVSGCDSLISTISLLVRPLVKNNATASVCSGGSYTLPSGAVVSIAGVYRDTLRYVAGCDSVINTVTLSVGTIIRVSLSPSICQGQAYTLPTGVVVNTAGTYIDTLRHVAGCDSLISIVKLSVNPLTRTTTSKAICAGEVYALPSGKQVNVSGIYNDTIRYVSGCDSLISTTTLTVKTSTRNNTNTSICEGGSYILPSGMVVNVAGVYNDTLRYSAGCDSVINSVTVAVNKLTRQNSSVFICQGENYTLPSGVIVNSGGTYADTIRYASGCDSLISTIEIAVRSLTRTNTTATICSGATFVLPSGKVINTAGSYADTVRYNSGCDSLISTVNLAIKVLTRSNINESICEGNTYTLPSGIVVNAVGVYNDTLHYASGCDSVINTINLTINKLNRHTSSVSICEGEKYTLPSSKIVSVPGTYIDTVKYYSGCDSLISTITISLKTTNRISVTNAICSGQTYVLPSGLPVSVTGIYRDTLRYPSGCDSLITIVNLTVNPLTRTSISSTVCAGQSYTLPSGKMINSTGIYNDTLRYTTGCDSLITTVTLLVKMPTMVTLNPSICIGQTYKLPTGIVVSTAGNYTDIIKDQSGCDSIVTTVALTINSNPSVSVIKSNDINCILGFATLTATGGSKYEWSPAGSLSNSKVPNPVATPSSTTVYTVKATSQYGCVSEDSIRLNVNINDAAGGYLLPSAFTPNDDGKNDCFGVSAWDAVSSLRFSVYHRTGRLLFHTTDPSKCWDGMFDGQKLGTGTYVYQVNAVTNCGNVFRKGTVVLIR